MKNRILYIIFLSIYLIPISASFGQNSYERQIKYWYLKDRLRYFIVPSDDPLNDNGTYLVMTSRSRNWSTNALFTEVADYGQENRLFGKYIGVLATEYFLLSNSGQVLEAQRTNDELINALSAYKRIDLCEEQVDPALQDSYDGFFIRHDVPEDWPSGTNSFISQSALNTDAGLLIDNDRLMENGLLRQVTHLTPDPPMTPFNEEMSQDEAIFLLEGLALTYKFGSSDAKTIAKDHAKKVLWRMWGYENAVHHRNWMIYGPYSWTLVPTGWDCNTNSWAIRKVARDFFGFNELMPPNPLSQEEWKFIFNGLSNPMNAHMAASLAAMSKVWGDFLHKTQYGIFNNTDQEGWDYYYLWLYKALWDDSWSLYNVDRIEDRLDEAPCEGPWLLSSNDHAVNGWASPERWSHAYEKQTGTDPEMVGIFSGMDYMILHNLYYINNGQGLTPYIDRANSISNRSWPSGSLGTSANPYNLEVFRSIVSTDILYNQPIPADVSYQAGENIILRPGFKAESGTHFIATIYPLDYCSNPPTDIPQGLNQYPPVPKYNGVESSSYERDDIINHFSNISSNIIQDDIKVFPNPSEDILIYPNPSTGFLNIKYAHEFSKYEVRTQFGELVLEGEIVSSGFILDASNLAKGLYILILKSSKDHYVCKISLI